ncbi:MAG TPA: hypothetical protein PK598_14000, partial [Thermoanaerobaculia bacterium]|nr:hypothetical protein [Thermoanaerobaculia bacterium]
MGRADPPVLLTLRQGRANLAQQRGVRGERLIDALHDQDAAPARENGGNEVRGEGAEHGEVEHADLETALVAEMVGHRFGIGHRAPLADDHEGSII